MYKVSEYHEYRVNNVYKIKVHENRKLNIVFFDDFNCIFMQMSHCQNSSKFLSVSYLMKTADVIMNFSSSHNTTDHT